MSRVFLAVVTIAALGGCARDATPAAAITPEPAASPARSTTTVEGSAELAPPAATPSPQRAAAPPPAAATPVTGAPTRSIQLAITGMT